jgi:hypothetical protein
MRRGGNAIMFRHDHFAALLISAALAAGCGGTGDSGEPAQSPCPPDEAYFVENIWTPIVSVSCISCHNADGVAKGSRLVLRRPSEPGFLTANFEIMRDLAHESVGDTSILLLRPTGRHPEGHPGGVLFDVASVQYDAMAAFVGKVVGDPAACESELSSCEAGTPGQRMLRRLTRAEYDQTIQDLFGFASDRGAAFAADTVVNGFDNNAAVLTVTPLLADQVRKAAEEIAAQAVTNVAALLPCDPAAGRECASTFVSQFGERAFRRPVSSDETTRYLEIFDLGSGLEAEPSFTRGIELVITAMLQSPAFLYRSELGEPMGGRMYQLTPYEIATELSYFLWGSMPDQELLAAARSGALATPAEIEAQARRMLASPKSRAMLDRFTDQWLAIEQVSVVPKDTMLYPELTPEIRAAMAGEAHRLVADVVRGGGSLSDLVRAPYTFVNDALAAFYGLPAPAEKDEQGFGRVELDDTRAGLLTLGAVLTTHARPNGSSPIHRGKLVRERFLCEHLPPPPPGVVAEPPALDPGLTTRERYAQHSIDQACAGCHRLMDPIGFAFDHFDGIGRYRADENGLAIDDTGTIAGAGEVPDVDAVEFQGMDGLAEFLAGSPETHECFALQWVRFAYGVRENGQLSCLIDEVQAQFAGGAMSIEDFVVALTQTSHFTTRVGADTGTPGDPGGPGDPGDGTEPDAGPGPDPGDGGDTSDLVAVAVGTDSQWETGSCHSVTVSNISDGDVDWKVTLPVNGMINNHWNAEMTQDGDQATFSGVSWNNVIAPGAAASFGFCVVF